jgi:factor associated with neutral sphingomyelinase activation
MTLQWQMKQITNYEYLMHLNEASNRSFSDLSQYPIYPWVISDYESEVLDLNNPKAFRDLAKPIGAINE